MVKELPDEYRLQDKIKLTIRVSYFASAFAILFSAISYYLLNITQVIPMVFLAFGLLNLLNTFLFKYHKNLSITYNALSVIGLTAAIIITLYSGGINSAFIFVLAIVVFAGYATTRRYGMIYLYISFIVIGLIYFQGISTFSLTSNVVPPESQNTFSFLAVLFSVYLLGGVLGKNLLRAHHQLYRTKTELENQIAEKATLLKEVHHRVKNNLQTVSSLLSLQSRSIEDEAIKSLIKSSQNRVISMAMVHEMLYMREDISKIEYSSYVKELSNYLLRSVRGMDSKVKLKIDVPDIELGIDTAIPLGLLINEAITNALKYGIKNDEEGEIHIAISRDDPENYTLKIGDNGIGFPEKINFKESKSLGLKLIYNLVRQLKGSIMRDTTRKGTNYIIKFREIGEVDLNSVA